MTTGHFPLPRQLVAREDFVLAHCTGKRVLHIGCADFSSSGDWRRRVESGAWLHARLRAVARELVGVDSAATAVRQMRDELGYADVYISDAQHLELPGTEPFDVIVAGELIEHLPNPGAFMNAATRFLRSDGTLVITTVNAFCVRRLLRVFFGVESVHEDHVAYYSHRTLARLAGLCGWEVHQQMSYRLTNRRPLFPFLVEALACKVSPNVGEGIIAVLRLPTDAGCDIGSPAYSSNGARA